MKEEKLREKSEGREIREESDGREEREEEKKQERDIMSGRREGVDRRRMKEEGKLRDKCEGTKGGRIIHHVE